MRLLASIAGGKPAVTREGRWLAAALFVVGVPLAGCTQHAPEAPHVEHPVEVRKIEGQDINRVTMTEKALERIGLQTGAVREQQVSRFDSPQRVVPQSALIYDPRGGTWVYTSPEPRTFIKHKVGVVYVENGWAVLNEGPPTGTVIVTMAAAEVYGADSGVGH
jgi:hypothetical protein